MQKSLISFLSRVLVALIFGIPVQLRAAGKGATVNILYTFQGGSDGGSPFSGVVNVGSVLYGTALQGGGDCGSSGGGSGCGTVFSVDLKSGAEKTIYSFKGNNDGWAPSGNLIVFNGFLYGTTEYGGDSNNCSTSHCGTVFSIDLTTGAEKVLYSFQGGNDGQNPFAGLIYANGLLYGTTAYGGGSYGGGTVFSVDPATGHESVVHSFRGSPTDGFYPIANLINVGNTLYGTTDGGGKTSSGGTVFSIDIPTGVEKVVYSFDTQLGDGFGPYAAVAYLNGSLFGTTYAGGAHGGGTVFSINATSGAETLLYSFGKKGTYGFEPESNLVYLNGKFYGTTAEGGGPSGNATAFSFLPTGGKPSFLNHNIGGLPSDLTAIGKTFYGTSSEGGSPSCGCGYVFSLKP